MDIDLIEKKIRELQILLGPGGLAAHAALTGSSAHGAVSAPTANQIITRDAAGRAQVVAPSAAADIARKDTVDAVQTNLTTHAALTNPHSATAAPTADRLVLRDAAGRAQIVAPSVAADILNKGTLDTHAALTGSSAHGAVSAPTASQLMTRDAAGRAQVVAPSVAADIATKGYVDGIGEVPAGVIAMWGTASPPAGWLICDGTAISETTYAALFAVIGHGFGGDPGGGNFYLPNFKGISPTGVGTQTINTRDKAGPTLGQVREDQFQGHWHTERFGGQADTSDKFRAGYISATNLTRVTPTGTKLDSITAPINDGSHGDPRSDYAYTHGPEIGIHFIIKT